MGLQRIKQSVFDTSDNFVLDSIADIPSIPLEEREGIIIVGGVGGGTFKYTPLVEQSQHNDMTVYSASGNKAAGVYGCWLRIFSSNQGTLEWAGLSDSSVNNLQTRYGVENLLVRITDPDLGGVFQFKSSQISLHDGVNNFNGWVRLSDLNITGDLNMNGHRIVNGAAALSNNDFVTYAQALSLAAQGNYIGIVPLFSPEYTGDGVTVAFDTEADGTENPLYLVPEAFEVCVDGQDQMPDHKGIPGDYYIDLGTGNVVFHTPPPADSKIIIKWFCPISLDDIDNFAITASDSEITHLIKDWFGKDAGDIIITTANAIEAVNLKDRFSRMPAFFPDITAMVEGYRTYAIGDTVGVEGSNLEGDGGIAFYFIRTQTEAIAMGLDYATGPHVLIPTEGEAWVAQYQLGAASSLLQRYLVNGDSPFSVPNTNNFILDIDTSALPMAAAFVLNLPDSPKARQRIEIRDSTGNFNNNPVSITPGVEQTIVMDTNLLHDYPHRTLVLMYNSETKNWSI